MSESTMRSRVVRALAPLNGVAMENLVGPGTPDVNYIEGWIELKQLRAWPVRPETLVRVPTFTPQQRIWHYRRRRAGGQSWFLLQVAKEWLLIDGAIAALTVNKSTRQELIHHATCHWIKFSEKDLCDVLSAVHQPPYEFTAAEFNRLRGDND